MSLQINSLCIVVLMMVISLSLAEKNIILDLLQSKYIYVNISDPPQKMKLYIDPSSSVNIIFERKCKGCSQTKQTFIPERSKTLKKSHIYFTHNTINGKFSGYYSNELFIFNNEISINLDFLLINETSSSLIECDGILGLGHNDNENLSEFAYMSLLDRLYNENIISSKQFAFVNDKQGKETLLIGNVINDEQVFPFIQTHTNKTSIFLLASDKEYPTAYTNLNGLTYWNGTAGSNSAKKLYRDLTAMLVFENQVKESMNTLIISNNKKDILNYYVFNLLFSKFTLTSSPSTNSVRLLAQTTPDIQTNENTYNNYSDVTNIIIKKNPLTNHDIVEFESSAIKQVNAGLIIGDDIIYYDVIKSQNSFNIDICDEVDDYLFLSLDHLKSDAVLFNYDDNTLTIYNCISCGTKTESKNYTFVFTIIFGVSFVIISFMFSVITYYIKVKKVSHVKILKHYNLII